MASSNFGEDLMEIEICSPDGLKASEVKTITAIGNSFRDTWRGYASFLVNDGQGSMEIGRRNKFRWTALDADIQRWKNKDIFLSCICKAPTCAKIEIIV